ncbi:hypothetical protein A3C28_06055 [Candidatus Roizmanbacteria bacterium RIFCSPHIGHO2_02_FULL_39_9]|uniref:Glucose/Sorbosone dehydrogenase domain-containing protein n=3 Tax=Candidatus Roizmaniibacteriota TaxID=1752723 RepID=A0A1F7I471_9BACT|nr:MAG: hypothetical protein A3C28_06055 [Candidatus Roizmanbacteria bacterium RIFCSPHIGHO2_02_FULL_39_9]OGK38159.1 MAG: hypothetical protein A3F60_03150 [Candidatus Roizmanbacteria bacterium RIFCSPHIGHO2_12_FULL_39_8]
MKRIILLVIFILTIELLFIFRNDAKDKALSLTSPSRPITSQKIDTAAITTIAENLDTPWAIAFLPDGGMLVTERFGKVRLIDKGGKLQEEPIASLSQVKEIGEGGLLGILLHPDFSSNHFVYLYYTYSNTGEDTFNRVVRMKYENNSLKDEEILVDSIPGNSNHNGGRIKFGPDRNLYITTGDAQNPSQAQDTSTLGGKILRVTDEGKPVSDNSFGNLVYSYGHRNPQGIDWNNAGKLWETEHGRSGIQSGLDEVNIIEKGKNYGWPIIQGDETREGMMTPITNSGGDTWAPAGAAFIGDRLFFGGLRGQALYEAVINGNDVSIKEHFKNQFGRIREVIKGPDDMLYITTSNQDGRGNPQTGDDKVLKINLNKL